MKPALKIVFAFCAGLWLALAAARAETDYWSDNFETNAVSHWAANSVWKIGTPTVGPPLNAAGYRSYSGSHCATTGLTGGAGDNVDGRLICTNYNGQSYLTIPPANQYPRLRYWQWLSFLNAEGFVEIQQAGTTNWQTVSSTNISQGGTTYYSSGIWSRPSIDMSAFAGDKVQVAFHFISGPNFGTDLGWYVDDVALVTNQPVFNNPEGFESGLGDWSVDSGTWQVGVPTTGPPTNSKGFRAHSGTNCAATVLGGNYGYNVDTRLITPPFTLPSSGSQVLRFSQWYSFLNAEGFIEVNSGIGITNVSNTTNYITATNTLVFTNVIAITNIVYYTNVFVTAVTNVNDVTNVDAVTNIYNVSTNVISEISVSTNIWQTISQTNISVGGDPFTSNGQWTNTTVDLSAYAGQTLQLAFHFISGPSGFGNAPGWYIDDISIEQPPLLSLPAQESIAGGQTFTVTASATNSTLPDAIYTFALASPSTNAFITPGGTLSWTNTQPAIGTNVLSVVVTDNSSPPFLVTNSIDVLVVTPTSQFSVSNAPPNAGNFLLALQSISNTTWQIEASTNLTSWQPVFTGSVTAGGLLLYTDLLVTNFPHRFYRAVFP